MKIEAVHLWGDVRWRFWVLSFWFPKNMVSDGGLYLTKKEAEAAALEFKGSA